MKILDILNDMGALTSVANDLGLNQSEVSSAAAALVPAILGGLKSQTQTQPAGLQGLLGLLGGLGGGGLLDEVLAPQPTSINRGNDVLRQVFGSKDVSRAVAQNAATRSGLDPDSLKRMLPVLAMLVVGYLSKHGAAPGVDASALQTGGGGTDPGVLQNLGSLIDLDGDGNPLNDILAMTDPLMR